MAKVTAEQLLKPQGDIDAALLFPDESYPVVRDQINSWLSKGYAHPDILLFSEADKNRAVEHFAYAKIYNDVHTRMAASPIRAEVSGEAGEQFDVFQIRQFAIKAEQHMAAFNSIIAEVGVVDVIEPTRSRSLINAYRW